MSGQHPECGICGGKNAEKIDFDFSLFSTESTNPEFHRYDSYVCDVCGVVFMHPQPDESELIAYYNSGYRRSGYALEIGGRWLDTPVNFEASIQSFQRFRNFYLAVTRLAAKFPGIVPNDHDTIVDYGGYQGAFLSAAAQAWGIQGIVVDYNAAGVEFAKKNFGFVDSIVTKDLASDRLPAKVRFATAVHSLEHIRKPQEFLEHVRQNVLGPDGFLYVEVPNASGSPLSNPTHFFMYGSKSLTCLLELSGFEALDIWFTGFPREHLLVGNPLENIVCIARPRRNSVVMRPTSSQASASVAAIRKEYRRLSERALRITFRNAIQGIWTLFVRLLMVGLIDHFPQRIARPIRAALVRLPKALSRR